MDKMSSERLKANPNWLFTLSRTADVTEGQLQTITDKMNMLGIRIHPNKQQWSDKITHVVYLYNEKPDSSFTQQVMCGLASGCWVLKSSFIFRSLKKNEWEPEQKHIAFSQCLQFRSLIEEHGEEGKPFYNMKAVFLTSLPDKKTAYLEIIKAGGGKTIPNILNFKELNLREWQEGEINHVFVDPFYIREKKEQRHFLFQFMERAQKKLGTVHFLKYLFIREYLKLGGVVSTENFVIRQADYQDLNRRENKRERSLRTNESASKKAKTAELVDLEDDTEQVILLSDDDHDTPEHVVHAYDDVPVVVNDDNAAQQSTDDDIECIEDLRFEKKPAVSCLYYETNKLPEKPRVVQNYAEVCRQQKEEANRKSEGTQEEPDDKLDQIALKLEAVLRESVASLPPISEDNSVPTLTPALEENASEGETAATRPPIRLVNLDRLRAPSTLQDDHSTFIPESSAPEVREKSSSPEITPRNSFNKERESINKTTPVICDKETTKAYNEYTEEYEESGDDYFEIKKESKSPIDDLKTNKTATAITTNATEKDVDVKPDLKPFVPKLLKMDSSVIESLVAAINERNLKTRKDFVFTNDGSKTTEYSLNIKGVDEQITLKPSKDIPCYYVTELYKSGNLKELRELKTRRNYLHKLQCSWNINSRFDKPAFNFLLHFCLFKETSKDVRRRSYKLLSDYAFIHLNKTTKYRESFVSTLLGCLFYHEKQTKLSLASSDGLARIGEWWSKLVEAVVSALKSDRDFTNTGCYMTLQLITNWMVKDFYIWWKYCRAKKTILPMIHHFHKEDIVNGASNSILPLYAACLKNDLSTDIPRRLISMCYLLINHFDSTKGGKSDISEGDKVKFLKKVAKCVSSVGLSDNHLFLEVNLLEPSLLSSAVSSYILTQGSCQVPSMDKLLSSITLDKEAKGSKSILLLENSIHKLTGALHLHNITRLEDQLSNKKPNSRITDIQKYYDQTKKEFELRIGEIKIPLDAFSGLNLKNELASFSKFRRGEVNLFSEKAEALQSLLFHDKDEVSSNQAEQKREQQKE